MYSDRFLKFIEIWQKEFAIERSINEGSCTDKEGNPIPWYTYPAIEYLSQFDYSDKTIFEFGCGYSSLYWARRSKKVISIEDNIVWYEKWCQAFNMKNLSILLRSKEDYYNAINENKAKYDVIVIDGKYRVECAIATIQKLKKGGIIILDDSDRANTSKEYKDAISILKQNNMIQVDFFGFCPLNNYTKTTSVFMSRSFNFKTCKDIQPANGIGNLWQMKRKQRKEFYKSNKPI